MDLPPMDELLKKIEDLEAGHAQLKQEISNLTIFRSRDGDDETSVGMMKERRRSQSASPKRLRPLQNSCSFRHVSPLQREYRCSDGGDGASRDLFNLSNMQYLNILQSMGQAVHILDCDDRIIYWNRTAENLYGFTAEEAIGKNVIELLTDFQDYNTASKIISRVVQGESWTGLFPVKNKGGKRFQIMATDTPFYDDDRKLVGLICVSSDCQAIQKVSDASLVVNQAEVNSTFHQLKCTAASKLGLDPKQPFHSAISSNLSNLASKISLKVSNKVRSTITGESSIISAGGNGDNNCALVVPANRAESLIFGEANTSKGFELNLNSSGKFYQDHDDLKEENFVITSTTVPCHTNGMVNRRNSSLSKQESKAGETQHATDSNTEASSSALPLFNVNSTNSASSSGSTSSATLNKLDFENDCLDYEISWEDLTIAEQIGQGSCGVVYHALWYGSDVAVKVFSKQEYSEDIILSFRQEISMMKKLRHPNVLLFMGAVASPDRLCIVTEFLPRGSLFGLLQKNAPKLDWRKRIQMAIDIARGVNYLHHFNPPIIHRDLKSSNLLVDRNWTLKVGDFGLSRLKHEAYLTMRTGRGTPQWMAPEVLRNEPSDEKSDVYSYGVVLWELVTQKIPWENHSSIQVVSAVGYMDQRLEIPTTVDRQWASIIESCWHSDSRSRPTFQELLDRLKDLQRKHLLRLKSARSGSAKAVQKNANTD